MQLLGSAVPSYSKLQWLVSFQHCSRLFWQEMAMVWFRKASEQGHPHSAYNLAVGHFTGIKTGRGFDAWSFVWYMKVMSWRDTLRLGELTWADGKRPPSSKYLNDINRIKMVLEWGLWRKTTQCLLLESSCPIVQITFFSNYKHWSR